MYRTQQDLCTHLCVRDCEFLTSSHQPLGKPLILSKNDNYSFAVMLMKMDRNRVRAREGQREKDERGNISTLPPCCRLGCNCSPLDYHYRVSKVEQTDLPQGQTPTEPLTSLM